MEPRQLSGVGDVGSSIDAMAFFVAVVTLLLQRHSSQAEVCVSLVGLPADRRGEVCTLRLAVDAAMTFDAVRAQAALALHPGPEDRAVAVVPPSNVVLAFGELTSVPMASATAAPAELVVSIRAVGSAWILAIDHDSRAVDSTWAFDFAEQVLGIAREAAVSPARRLTDFSLLTERAVSILPDPSQPLEMPAHALIADTIREWAVSSPEAIAVVFDGRDFTYGQLAAFAERVARAIAARGVPPGCTVAVTGRRSFALVGAMIGVLRAGGVLVMLDPKLPRQRRQIMIEQSGSALLFSVCAQGDARDATATKENFGLPVLTCEEDGDVVGWSDTPDVWIPPRLGPDEPAYIFFTSGSTGMPKAVRGRHAGLSHFLSWQRSTFEVGPGDRASQLTALSFDVVLRDTFLALGAGATLCIPAEEDVLDPSRILAWLESTGVSIVHIVPSLARLWLDYVPADVTLRSLRCVFFAGEPLTDVLVERWRCAFPGDAQIINLYGPTETTLAKCFRRVPAPPDPGVQLIGRPLPQTQVLILDKSRRPCGLNEAGEIAIRTPFRTSGYLGNEPANAAAFMVNPWRNDADDLVYLTGDSGRYRSDGMLEIRGRIDNQVKIRGVRIEPAEIEACLARHPAVAACVVVARDSDAGEKFLVAYVVDRVREEESDTAGDHRAFLRERLPETMIPSAFVRLEALPLNANGKVDKKALPAPDLVSRSASSFVAPENDLQRRVSEIWCHVLGLERIGIDDSFFDIGGHSLLAVQLVRRVESEIGLPCELSDLFAESTIRKLTAVLGKPREGRVDATVIPLQRKGRALPLFCICGIHLYQELANRFSPDVPVYGIFVPSERILYEQRVDATVPLPGVEEMAAEYVRAVRSAQPSGPYRLMGVSFGGVLAFEMAQQLHRAGEHVTYLALLDSMLPAALRRNWFRWATEHARRAHAEGVRALAGRLLRRMRPRRELPDAGYDDENARLGALRQSIYAAATRRYVPRAYAGRALLVRAIDQGFFKSDICDSTYGWGRLVAKLRICDAQGDHLSILVPPNVDALAAELRSELDRSEAGGQTNDGRPRPAPGIAAVPPTQASG